MNVPLVRWLHQRDFSVLWDNYQEFQGQTGSFFLYPPPKSLPSPSKTLPKPRENYISSLEMYISSLEMYISNLKMYKSSLEI